MASESVIDPLVVMFSVSGFVAIAMLVSSIIAIKGNAKKK